MGTYTIIKDLDHLSFINCHSVAKAEDCYSLINHHSTKILTLNIRSVNHNFDDFLVLLNRLKLDFDIIIFTECWIKDTSTIEQLDGYLQFNTTKFINKAGGVIAYVKEALSPQCIEPDVNESNSLAIIIKGYVTVLAIYRSPSFANTDPFINSLHDVIIELDRDPIFVVTGDININILDTAFNSNNTTEYLCMMSELGFLAAVDKPTRNESLLDHVFIKGKTGAGTIVTSSSVTDHRTVITGLTPDVIAPSKPPSYKMRYNFKNIISALNNVDWTKLQGVQKVEDQTNIFVGIIRDIMEHNSAKIKTRRKTIILKPWMTRGLIRCSEVRDYLHEKAKKKPKNDINNIIYLRYRNFYTDLLRKIKNLYNSNLIEMHQKDSKKLWNIINDITHRKKANMTDKVLHIKETPEESVNALNDHFASIGRSLAFSILERLKVTVDFLARKIDTSGSPVNSFYLNPTDYYEIESIINSLKPNSAPGIDKINNKLVKGAKNCIVPPLTDIINKSMESGIVPDAFKIANITPIHKGGDSTDSNNYRPISLLPALSKVMEKVVNRRLMSYLEGKGMLSDKQFGFRRGRSTEGAVRTLTDKISSYLDAGRPCIGVFLDLAKAFDTVAVPILLKRMEKLGVRGIALKWFDSYLAGRTQQVNVNNTSSSTREVAFGVPQGSVLGPTLFLAYLNDLCLLKLEDADIVCYADDTAIVFHNTTWEACFLSANRGMAKISKWLSENLLTLNTDKTKYLCFFKTAASAPKAQFKLVVHICKSDISNGIPNFCNCDNIARSSTIKYLGVTLDERLTFLNHIEATAARIRKMIYMFKQLRNVASTKILHSVYTALCEPILTYCLEVWGAAAKSHLNCLEKAQKAVLKVMYNKPFRYPTSQLFSETRVLSIRKLYIMRAVTSTHKMVLNADNYQTLQNKRVFKIPVPFVKTVFASRFPPFMFPFLYNIFFKHHDMREMSVFEVKRKVKEQLINMTPNDCDTLMITTKL